MKKKILDLNKNISYNYHVKEKYECGIVLFANEIKSIKHNGCNILGSYVVFNKLESWVVNLYINNLKTNETNIKNRKKKILLHKKQIKYLFIFSKIKGNTVIPSAVYWKNNFIKIELCLAIGKKTYDKRLSLKKKEWELAKQKIITG